MLKIFIFILITVTLCWAGQPRYNIERPCQLTDKTCIGNYLSAYSECEAVKNGSIPHSYVVQEFRFETPAMAATYYDRNLLVINHDNCYVSEFYTNTVTGVTVFGLDCKNFYLESDRVLIQHFSLREDQYFYYHFKATYPHIRMTVNLRPDRNMNFCTAYVYTQVLECPIFHVDPQDKPTEKFLSKDTSQLMLFETENFFLRGYPIVRIYMDSTICDYNCKRHLFD